MKGEILGFGAALVLFTSAAIWLNRKQIREWWNREPVRLGPDHETHRPADASTGSAGRCNQYRPHEMVADPHGWVCANEGCGERWYVSEIDDLATADIALWELELEDAEGGS